MWDVAMENGGGGYLGLGWWWWMKCMCNDDTRAKQSKAKMCKKQDGGVPRTSIQRL